MKKSVSFALLLLIVGLATAAVAEEATFKPLFRTPYRCDYSPGPWTNEYDPGISSFGNEQWFDTDGDGIRLNLVYAIEGYEATPYGWDNRRIAFAKPVDWCGIYDPQCLDPYSVVRHTKWEFTIQNGVQCTDTRVSNDGRRIAFYGCSNGKSRVCDKI